MAGPVFQPVSVKSETDTSFVLEGPAVVFGGEDLTGEYMDGATDFWLKSLGPTRPALYDHGFNAEIKDAIIGTATLDERDDGVWFTTEGGYGQATDETRVWIQPPYDIVLQALAHYGHTRFTALLRLDTSTLWFDQLWNLSEVIMVPKRDRLAFVPPPGVDASSNPFPHGLYYKRAVDVTDAVRDLCYPWPCPAYPYHEDPLGLV